MPTCLIDEGLRAGKAMAMTDVAREAIAVCGGGYTVEAVADLAIGSLAATAQRAVR